MIDYHVHPGYSIDAEPHSIDDYCRKAVSMGLKEICFTPHLEVDPVRKHLDWFVRVNGSVLPMEELHWLDNYFREIESARQKWFAAGVSVKAGLEVGYERGTEKVIERVVLNYPFDFIIGSVHCLEHHAISSQRESSLYFPGKEIDFVVNEYFKILEEAVSTGLFDCIGHADLYRRYGSNYFSEELIKECEIAAEGLFKKAASKGVGLEVNTSSLRRGHSEFHPTFSMIEMALCSGISFFTVGSDAHRLDDLGCGIKEAQEMLAGLGIKPTTYTLRRAGV